MSRYRNWLLGAALAGGLASATPGAAATIVNFSFMADTTPVVGVFTLDCPAGDGPCAILSVTGKFGALDLTPPPPGPPPPPTSPPPDNELTRPGYRPTPLGDSFFMGDIVMVLTEEQEMKLRAYQYEQDAVEFVQAYTVTDYHTSVPEPAAWALLLGGLGGVGALVRARRSNRRLVRS